MIYLLIAFLLGLVFYGPAVWVKYVMWKHSKPMADMPGTGSELAKHLLERFELNQVQVVQGGDGEDYYDHAQHKLSLSPSVMKGKSLTAVAVATHEVGHALQFCRNEPVILLRQKYMPMIFRVKQVASSVLVILPIAAAILKLPGLVAMTFIIGGGAMLASVGLYLAMLPEEYDASFRKALPILAEGYVPDEYLPAIKQVLRAAALTYVAAALAEMINLWRWLRYLRPR